MSDPILTVNNVSKVYQRHSSMWLRLATWLGLRKPEVNEDKAFWANRDISFTVQPGEAIGIVGQNGAGKSTLLKMITGTVRPTSGQISMKGRVSALLELGIGFNPEFTGRQNVIMAGGLMGLSPAQLSEIMPEIAEFAELGEFFNMPLRVYSSGMQARLGFAVATAIRPDVLIVDEALSVGDAYFQAKCFQRINQFKLQGTTLILVTHSTGDVVKHCERAILLKDGRIKIDGPSREVTNVYLDELFGKKAAIKKIGGGGVVLDSSESLLPGLNDDFHTRPGYHNNEHRWGHGGAVILDYLIESGDKKYPSRIESNSPTAFHFKVRFDEDYLSVVPGFLIKTLEGIFLYGTNSFLSSNGQQTVTAKAGDTKIFKFSLPLTLNEGYYMVSFGVASGDPMGELQPLDRRYDSVLIHIGRTMQFWGIVDLEASFELIEPTSTNQGYSN